MPGACDQLCEKMSCREQRGFDKGRAGHGGSVKGSSSPGSLCALCQRFNAWQGALPVPQGWVRGQQLAGRCWSVPRARGVCYSHQLLKVL